MVEDDDVVVMVVRVTVTGMAVDLGAHADEKDPETIQQQALWKGGRGTLEVLSPPPRRLVPRTRLKTMNTTKKNKTPRQEDHCKFEASLNYTVQSPKKKGGGSEKMQKDRGALNVVFECARLKTVNEV